MLWEEGGETQGEEYTTEVEGRLSSLLSDYRNSHFFQPDWLHRYDH